MPTTLPPAGQLVEAKLIQTLPLVQADAELAATDSIARQSAVLTRSSRSCLGAVNNGALPYPYLPVALERSIILRVEWVAQQ